MSALHLSLSVPNIWF